MLCVIFGPPGSGKGTQAKALCDRFGMTHVSTGDMLREAVSAKTELGQEAGRYMQDGALVPDELVGGIVRETVLRLCREGKGILFDGYPRNLQQAEFLDSCLSEADSRIDCVAAIEIDADELVQRICGRRMCPDCGEGFNVFSLAPKKEGICDKCGGTLTQRKDDTEEVLRERLNVYSNETLPILDYYSSQDVLIRVAGNATVGQVRDALLDGIASKCEKEASG